MHARVYDFSKTEFSDLAWYFQKIKYCYEEGYATGFCSKQLASSLVIKLIHFLKASINSN